MLKTFEQFSNTGDSSQPSKIEKAKGFDAFKYEELPDWVRRSVDFTQQELLFRYGELKEDHPINKLVDRLASKLIQSPEFPIKNVKVLPDWYATNALCFPDGTVFISMGMIKNAKTEEALVGVIAHEYIHFQRSHTAKKVEISLSAFLLN